LNDVLDFSKVESGQMSVEMAGFDLKSVIRQVASIYKPLVTEAKIEFSLTIDDSLKSGYLGDAERIKQILNNLLSNALKFTKSGKIEVYASDRSGELNIKVSDTGIGIHHSQHAFIFDAFKQAGSEIATKFGGTGLGLTLCQRMAHLMGGDTMRSPHHPLSLGRMAMSCFRRTNERISRQGFWWWMTTLLTECCCWIS
jgi:two-component system capsular synthesis sensor histidine kinase RcsC